MLKTLYLIISCLLGYQFKAIKPDMLQWEEYIFISDTNPLKRANYDGVIINDNFNFNESGWKLQVDTIISKNEFHVVHCSFQLNYLSDESFLLVEKKTVSNNSKKILKGDMCYPIRKGVNNINAYFFESTEKECKDLKKLEASGVKTILGKLKNSKNQKVIEYLENVPHHLHLNFYTYSFSRYTPNQLKKLFDFTDDPSSLKIRKFLNKLKKPNLENNFIPLMLKKKKKGFLNILDRFENRINKFCRKYELLPGKNITYLSFV